MSKDLDNSVVLSENSGAPQACLSTTAEFTEEMKAPMFSSASQPTTDQTSVYKYYDSKRILLYVGITSTGVLRNRQHNSDKEWWPFVTAQEVEHFRTRAEAHGREVALIQQFRPPFNVQHNPDHPVLRAAYVALRGSPQFEISSAKHLVSAGGKRVISLSQVWERDCLAFITHPFDAPIVAQLRLPPSRRVFVSRLVNQSDAACIGKVKRIELGPAGARIVTKARMPKGMRIQEASAKLHYVAMKPVVIVELLKVMVRFVADEVGSVESQG